MKYSSVTVTPMISEQDGIWMPNIYNYPYINVSTVVFDMIMSKEDYNGILI